MSQNEGSVREAASSASLATCSFSVLQVAEELVAYLQAVRLAEAAAAGKLQAAPEPIGAEESAAAELATAIKAACMGVPLSPSSLVPDDLQTDNTESGRTIALAHTSTAENHDGCQYHQQPLDEASLDVPEFAIRTLRGNSMYTLPQMMVRRCPHSCAAWLRLCK